MARRYGSVLDATVSSKSSACLDDGDGVVPLPTSCSASDTNSSCGCSLLARLSTLTAWAVSPRKRACAAAMVCQLASPTPLFWAPPPPPLPPPLAPPPPPPPPPLAPPPSPSPFRSGNRDPRPQLHMSRQSCRWWGRFVATVSNLGTPSFLQMAFTQPSQPARPGACAPSASRRCGMLPIRSPVSVNLAGHQRHRVCREKWPAYPGRWSICCGLPCS
ncbi:hypothetical protein VTK73DRAFT_4492 [Phialemonium thermophilum]|uniref:Uncharacterized protein n=1 Tax=Phialemonium thermophilum TaxID=223376 RepID=A0ABR3V8E2_9PEZI